MGKHFNKRIGKEYKTCGKQTHEILRKEVKNQAMKHPMCLKKLVPLKDFKQKSDGIRCAF